MPNLPSEVGFCALLSYSTHPATEAQQQAKDVALALKQGRIYGQPPCTICDLVAQRVLEHQAVTAFVGVFGPNVLAVPIPSSSLKKPGSLEVPLELAKALKARGLVGDVLSLVTRTRALPKSAYSRPGERSKAIDHYNSIHVAKVLIAPAAILLVDDVITRGATLLGICARVMEAYPGIPVHGFAAMRAVSSPEEFVSLVDPRRGQVSLRGEQTFRTP